MPAKFVRPYVKSNLSDIIDAEAIAEAVSRPTMRFVEIRSPEQVELQALHRVRDRLVAGSYAPQEPSRLPPNLAFQGRVANPCLRHSSFVLSPAWCLESPQ
jgi:hypothetical protein